jgi:hypothetical protein
MKEDQYYDYLIPKEGVDKLKSFVDTMSSENKEFFTRRFNKAWSQDFYLGFYSAIRVLQSFPELPKEISDFVGQLGIGCSCVIAEKSPKTEL